MDNKFKLKEMKADDKKIIYEVYSSSSFQFLNKIGIKATQHDEIKKLYSIKRE